jgi:mono/diheme cytochrome c family protein
MKAFFYGLLSAAVLALAGGYAFVVTGMMPANADSPPPGLEKWAAHRSLKAAIAREAPLGAGPVALDDAALVAGVKVYAQNCLVCHGGADGQASNIALGLYQHAPQLATHGVEDDAEGETYWKVHHGIRLTGMPGFSQTLTEQQQWQVTLFLKHMDSLSPAVAKAWKALALPSAQAAVR